MKSRTVAYRMLAIVALVAGGATIHAQHAVRRPIDGRPDAVVDLRTVDGVELAKGQWRYTDATIRQADFNAPGRDLKPSGAPIKTTDLFPRPADANAFDTAPWQPIDPPSLEARRSTGRLSFSWYRTSVTVPERVGAFDTAGSTVVFEIVVDDYAEVWVDGKLPRTLGQAGADLIKGFNAPNRVVLTTDARPGDTFQIAVLGINGPLSDPPSNFIWVRSATLDFYKRDATAAPMVAPRIVRADPGLDDILPADAMLEKVAEAFLFKEGPIWVPEGYLLFSDPNNNTIYRWSDRDGLSVFRPKSGYTGFDIGQYGQPGSNGLTLDREGRLTINEHGNRRVTRLEKNGSLTVLADRYNGQRLNSPNDLVYKSDGSLYFTDPPFGLPKFFDDPRKETPFSGVYRWTDGSLQLLTTELSGPNGIAFSPDERFLYVGNWDEKKKIVMRYEMAPDGTLRDGRVFFDMTAAPGEDAIDGIKVDQRGNLYVSGPGGLWILSAEGKYLGTIVGPEHPHNMAWGGGLYRIRLRIPAHAAL